MSDAILFVQLGSPSDASPQNVEKYLVDFLGDPHTLGNPPFFWKWLLRGIIAPRRSVKSAEKYRRMIDSAGLGEMPLIHYTRLFAERMSSEISRVPVRYAFEFGSKPSITDALAEFSKRLDGNLCYSAFSAALPGDDGCGQGPGESRIPEISEPENALFRWLCHEALLSR